MKNKGKPLLEALAAYGESGVYPMHMPGHKRNRSLLGDDLPWGLDITEIGDFDNLANPTGILADCEDRAARLWGAAAFYLLGGSTCGILGGIYSAVSSGDKVLLAGNCHKSVYHAVELLGLTPVYLAPLPVEGFSFCGSVSPKAVENLLSEEPEIRLAVIPSPTYEGVISDVAAIARILHKKGVPLLVDEAHGAHLGLWGGFPEGAIACGADIVIHSLHKTLPSLTQTAVAHVQGPLISKELFRHALSVFQSSSPSYPLMASIDSCVHMLSGQGSALFEKWAQRIAAFSGKAGALKRLRVFNCGGDRAEKHSGVYRFDPGKILISCKNTDYTGAGLAARLLSEYKIQIEMAMGEYVLAMTSICDSDEGMKRLMNALLELDRSCIPRGGAAEDAPLPMPAERVQKIPSGEAVKRPGETVPFLESDGRISQEYLWVYPPGVPLLVPGQVIERALVARVLSIGRRAVSVASTYNTMPDAIRVLRKEEERPHRN